MKHFVTKFFFHTRILLSLEHYKFVGSFVITLRLYSIELTVEKLSNSFTC